MQTIMDEAAETVFARTSQTPRTGNNKQDTKVVLVIRDMLQSLGIPATMHHPNLLAVYQLIGKFNAVPNSQVKIAALEGWSGALPQLDMTRGRGEILRPLRETQEALSFDIPQRFLVRGPFGVRISAMHRDDLEFLLTKMAEAAGAHQGRPVIFKLFEAQNTVAEQTKTLEIIRDLRKKGYNVQVELAVCYTASDKLNASYYQATAEKMLDNAISIDPGAICGISLKDMIGMIEPESVRELASVFMRVIHKKIPGAYFALHAHQDETAAALIAAHKVFSENAESGNLRLDCLPGGFGFPDAFKVLEGIGAKLSADQQGILEEIERNIRGLIGEYGYSADSPWSREQLVYGRIPGGAVPTAVRDVVEPVTKKLISLLGVKERPKTSAERERLEQLVADLYIHVNRQLATDCGEAHSVTPAARNFGFLAKEVMTGMMKNSAFRAGFVAGKVNLELGNQDILATVRTHYDQATYSDKNAKDAIDYFRGQMPFPIDEKLMQVFCRQSIKNAFPDWLESLAKALDALDTNIPNRARVKDVHSYTGNRHAQALAKLLARPTDKTYASRVLLESFFPHETARYPDWPSMPGAADKIQNIVNTITNHIEQFVQGHVGQRETLFDQNAKPQNKTIRALIEKIPAEELAVPIDDAVCYALLYGEAAVTTKVGARGGIETTLSPDVVQGITHPVDRWPTYWPKTSLRKDEVILYGNRLGATETEWELIEVLRSAGVRTLQGLREKRGDEYAAHARFLYEKHKNEPIGGTYLFDNWEAPQPPSAPPVVPAASGATASNHSLV